jgi:predicted Zn-dependent protease
MLLSGCAGSATVGGPSGSHEESVSAVKVNRISERLLAASYPECNTTDEAAAKSRPRFCGIEFRVTGSYRVNAGANRHGVKITEGMLRFVRNEEELAFVLAHEMAHITLGHFGSLAYTGRTQLEYEADAEAVRMLAAADYDIRQAPDVLRRMSRKYRGADRMAATHPSFEKRMHRVMGQIKDFRHTNQAMAN